MFLGDASARRNRKKMSGSYIFGGKHGSVCARVCVYMEASLLQVSDRVAGHFILQRLRHGFPGDGGDGLGFLGNLCLVVGEVKHHTWERTIAHLQV